MDELRIALDSVKDKLKDLFNRVNQLEAAPTVTSGSGGGAPVDAQYLVLAFNAVLTNERRLDFSARFATVDGGAGGDYDVDLAASGVAAAVYGSATQSPQITVDVYGRITNAVNVAITGVPPLAHPLLGNTYHNDVTTQGPTRGSLIYGNATPLWDELVLGGISGSIVTRDANDVLWSAFALAGTAAQTYTFPPASATLVGGTGANTYVAYWNGVNSITGSSAFIWDGTLKVQAATAARSGITSQSTDNNATNDMLACLNSAGTRRFYVRGDGTLVHSAFTTASITAGAAFGESNTVNTGTFSGVSTTMNSAPASVGGAIQIAGGAFQGTNSAGAGINFTQASTYIAGGLFNAQHTGAGNLSNMAGGRFSITKGAGSGTTTNAYGIYCLSTVAGGALSNQYGIYIESINAATALNYAIYTNDGLVRFGDDVLIGTTSDLAQAVVVQSSGTGAQPVMYLDQRDVSEQHIVCSINGTDVDFPNILQLNVTGSPALWWDESEDAFGFKNLSGILVEDADWIGNSSATARLVFDSSGVTDYAYFSSCNVGIGDTTPTYTLDVNGKIGVNDVQTIYNASALDFANFASSLFIGDGGASVAHTGGSEGWSNTSAGVLALYDITTGFRDTATGAAALENITTGAENTAIGAGAGRVDALAADVATNDDCVYIGYNVTSALNGSDYEIVIGANTTGNGSNTTTIGTAAQTDAYIFGNHIIENQHFVGITGDVRLELDSTNGYIKAILGDAAGADEFRVLDSALGVMAGIDSDGNIYTLSQFEMQSGQSAFYTDGNPHIYRTLATGGAFPFLTAGNIVVQPRCDGTPRYIVFATGNTPDVAMVIDTVRDVGIGTISPAGKLTIDQSSTTGAIPVLELDQADLSEEFINFISTVGAGNPIDTAALGAYYGKVRVQVQGVGYKYMALYDS